MSKANTPRVDDFVQELLADDSPQAAPEAAQPAVQKQAAPPASPEPALPKNVPTELEDAQEDCPLDLSKWLQPAANVEDEIPQRQPLRCISFNLNQQWYAAEVSSLFEVLAKADIVKIPSLSMPVLGILNLRGNIVPVIDPSGLLSLPPRQEAPGQLIIVDHETQPVALCIDHIGEVISLNEEEIQPSPGNATHVKGVAAANDEMLTLIDLSELIKTAFGHS